MTSVCCPHLQIVYDDGDQEQLVLGAVVPVKLKVSTLETSLLPSGQQLVQLAGVLLDLAAAAEVEAAATTGKPATRRKKEKEAEELHLKAQHLLELSDDVWLAPAACEPSASKPAGQQRKTTGTAATPATAAVAIELTDQQQHCQLQPELAALQLPASQQVSAAQDAAGKLLRGGAVHAANIPGLGYSQVEWLWQQLGPGTMDLTLRVAPEALVGRYLRVFWPLDDAWFLGSVEDWNPETATHKVVYDDGSTEQLWMGLQRVRLLISKGEQLPAPDASVLQQLAKAGEPVWVRSQGNPPWPAIIITTEEADDFSIPKGLLRAPQVCVQFFGDYTRARVGPSALIPCKEALEQRLWLPTLVLQNRRKLMDIYRLSLQELITYCKSGELPDPQMLPLHLSANLVLLSLGRVEFLHPHFHNEKFIFPVGFAVKRRARTAAGGQESWHLAEILDQPDGSGPLITPESGEAVSGVTPTQAMPNAVDCERFMAWSIDEPERPQPQRLTPELLLAKRAITARLQSLPPGVSGHPLQRHIVGACDACGEEVELADNLLMECDHCRVLVHQRCYGVSHHPDGGSWLCDVCQLPGLSAPPPCMLCPRIGGAMKATAEGGWCHLLCATWVPGLCVADHIRMEPIIGVSRVSKDRRSLVCSICHQQYGACIQCCSGNNTPAAGTGLGPAGAAGGGAGQQDMASSDQQPCSAPATAWPAGKAQAKPEGLAAEGVPLDPLAAAGGASTCARSRASDLVLRRGLKAPDALAAALRKRLFVRALPYVVTSSTCAGKLLPPPAKRGRTSGREFDHCQADLHQQQRQQHLSRQADHTIRTAAAKACPGSGGEGMSQLQRYQQMQSSVRDRVASGKSAIHGLGVFAKIPHRAGDYIVEYQGSLVRPLVADRLEARTYNQMVGAGTYIFRLNADFNVDATRSGNIAHLINHSCAPCCHSRTVTLVCHETGLKRDHVLIVASRDIAVGEELTYDYRFAGDEKLRCNCGASSCRGWVNYPHSCDSPQQGVLTLPRQEVMRIAAGLAAADADKGAVTTPRRLAL
eukprot:gene4536-4788_t